MMTPRHIVIKHYKIVEEEEDADEAVEEEWKENQVSVDQSISRESRRLNLKELNLEDVLNNDVKMGIGKR